MNQKKEIFLKKFFALVGLISLLVLAGYQILPSLLVSSPSSNNQEIINNQPIEIIDNQPINLPLEEKEEIPVIEPEPTKILLDVPFISQAPNGIWDELHNEACEEASLIMANAFLKKESLDAATAEQQIQEMVAWQIKNWGEHKDLTLEEENQLAQAMYGYQNFRVEKNIKAEDIKTEIKNGHIVILPMAGRLLKNPYFKNPGPYYHMLVVIGYDNDNFITNDPGTKRGKHYIYSAETLFNALHDWAGKDQDITTGGKNMLVIEP